MQDKNKPDSLTERQMNIRAFGKFITPVSVTIRKPLQFDSLEAAYEAQSRQEITNRMISQTEKHGTGKAQALIYEKLLAADLLLVDPNDNKPAYDTEHFLNIAVELKNAGLFNTAKSVELLLAKTKLVRNVSHVIISKKAQASRKAKDEVITNQMRVNLEEYKSSLKLWALGKYSGDCQYRLKRNEPKRAKRTGDIAADKWLLAMAEEDLQLSLLDPSILNDALVEGLTEEGNFHGSPEQPDHLLGFKLSLKFFYRCLKE